jgi:hypothetical protein
VRADRTERLPLAGERAFRILAVAGGAALVLGLFLSPQRAFANLLAASFGLVCLGLAGTVFVALQYVTGARWSVALRRVPEAMTAALPLGGVGIIAVLVARPALYPWHEGHLHGAGGDLGPKLWWLSEPFFTARAAVYLALWVVFSCVVVRNSRRQDAEGTPERTRRNTALSAAFLVVFALTFWLASFDWIMSLEPDWYSTMFGVYNFAGLFLSGLALMAILVVWLERAGPLRGVVRPEHRGDLGALIGAFATFWMYIWFCQYMLIWYANIPEETAYFVPRVRGGWGALVLASLVLNWGAPFLLLLPRANKRAPGTLAAASWLVLAGRVVDLYVMVGPPLLGPHAIPGIWEIAAVTAAAGIFGVGFARALGKAAPVPTGDPYLREAPGQHPA